MPPSTVKRMVASLGAGLLVVGVPIVTLAHAASALTALKLTVTTTLDAPDAHPGDGLCADTDAA